MSESKGGKLVAGKQDYTYPWRATDMEGLTRTLSGSSILESTWDDHLVHIGSISCRFSFTISVAVRGLFRHGGIVEFK